MAAKVLCVAIEHLEMSLAEYVNCEDCHKQKHNGDESESGDRRGLGLSLDLVKCIGLQVAAILRLLCHNGLNLIYGNLKPCNVFFKRKGVPVFKLIDFSTAFFRDQLPTAALDINAIYRAPELVQLIAART